MAFALGISLLNESQERFVDDQREGSVRCARDSLAEA